MNTNLPLGFRSLFDELFNECEKPCEEILNKHQREIAHLMAGLNKFGDQEARHWKTGEHPDLNKELISDLWDLYALSRVNDLLILPFQSGCDDDDAGWNGPDISRPRYEAFMVSLGLGTIDEKRFHPFFHEIVEVEPSSDETEPISLVSTLWPGFMLGRMMFSRAGVKVRGGENHLKKYIAENSTLYWTFRRNYRPVDDLSHGWGSNSQWRTDFRRDYLSDSNFYFNVDGKLEIELAATSNAVENSADENLTSAERIELLTNRCFILTEKPHHDLWPYDDFYIEARGPIVLQS